MLARRFCAFAVSARQIPLAPHLHYPQFMDDTDPDARELAMFFNRILLSKCEQLWAYIRRVSAGMRAEIDWAHQMDIPVRLFGADFHVAMSRGIFLDGRYIHGLIGTARHGVGSLRPRTPVTSSANEFTSLQPVKNIFEAVVPLKPATCTASQQVVRWLGELYKQGKATLRIKLAKMIETPRRPRAGRKCS